MIPARLHPNVPYAPDHAGVEHGGAGRHGNRTFGCRRRVWFTRDSVRPRDSKDEPSEEEMADSRWSRWSPISWRSHHARRIGTYAGAGPYDDPYDSDDLFDKCFIVVFEAILNVSSHSPGLPANIITYGMVYLVLLTSMSSGFTLGSVTRLLKAWHGKSMDRSGAR
jgi:hypothetical protein